MAEDSTLNNQTLDALIVGAGLCGMYHLHQLRKIGLTVKVVEAGSDLGGTWYWNRYPGARVDSDYTVYQFLTDDLWKGFTWTERFPGRQEILAYIEYLDATLGLRRDMIFDTSIISAVFDESTARWTVTTTKGATFHARFLLLCTGFASRPHIPAFPSLETFRGACYHSARFPSDDAQTVFGGKRVGVIGTGASGVQVIQEAGPTAAHLTVFQRTPQFALPMQQYGVDAEKTALMMAGADPLLPHILRRRFQTFSGTYYDPQPKALRDVSHEEQRMVFEEQWARGGFHPYLGTYMDVFIDRKASDILYAFWRGKVLQRVESAEMREKLAPEKSLSAVGANRFPCLEQTYYEVFNQPNVVLVDLTETPIMEVTPRGVRTGGGVEHELDVLVLATGFEHIKTGITHIDIRGPQGVPIREKWDARLSTYLGLMSAGYPNLFFPFGPHAPTAATNGPTCIELQGSWITECIKHMMNSNLTRLEPTLEAEDEWYKLVQEKFSILLWGQETRSKTSNGEVGEASIFCGGIAGYAKLCQDSADNGYKGFILS